MTGTPTPPPTASAPSKMPLILAIIVGILWIGLASRLGVIGSGLSIAGIVALIALKAKLPTVTPRKTAIGLLVVGTLVGLQQRPTQAAPVARQPTPPPTLTPTPTPTSMPAPVAVTPTQAPTPTAPVPMAVPAAATDGVPKVDPAPAATTSTPATGLPHPNQYLVDGLLAAFPDLKQEFFIRNKSQGNQIASGSWKRDPQSPGLISVVLNPVSGFNLSLNAPPKPNQQGDGGFDPIAVVNDAGKAIAVFLKNEVSAEDATAAVGAAVQQYAKNEKPLQTNKFTVGGEAFTIFGALQDKGGAKGNFTYFIGAKKLRE